MSLFYLALAAVIGSAAAARSHWLRALAALVAGAALAMIAWSIWLAHDDGTFAMRPGDWRPPLLDLMGTIAAVSALALVALPFAAPRPGLPDLPLGNSRDRFGRVARLLHWASATLMLVTVPIGLFVIVLPESRLERADFLAAHVAIGCALLALLVLRLGWRRVSPPPAAETAARAGQAGLLVSIGAGGITGLWLAAALGIALPFGPLPAAPAADAARLAHLAAVALFAAIFAVHLAAALWRRFGRGEALSMVG